MQRDNGPSFIGWMKDIAANMLDGVFAEQSTATDEAVPQQSEQDTQTLQEQINVALRVTRRNYGEESYQDLMKTLSDNPELYNYPHLPEIILYQPLLYKYLGVEPIQYERAGTLDTDKGCFGIAGINYWTASQLYWLRGDDQKAINLATSASSVLLKYLEQLSIGEGEKLEGGQRVPIERAFTVLFQMSMQLLQNPIVKNDNTRLELGVSNLIQAVSYSLDSGVSSSALSQHINQISILMLTLKRKGLGDEFTTYNYEKMLDKLNARENILPNELNYEVVKNLNIYVLFELVHAINTDLKRNFGRGINISDLEAANISACIASIKPKDKYENDHLQFLSSTLIKEMHLLRFQNIQQRRDNNLSLPRLKNF